MTSRSRILANLDSRDDVKSVSHPLQNQKVSPLEKPLADIENRSQRRTVNAFHPENFKATTLFSSVPAQTSEKQSSITNFCSLGKENSTIKRKNKHGSKLTEAVHKSSVFHVNDSAIAKKDASDAVKTDVSQHNKDSAKTREDSLIFDEHPSGKYWELLAEERRKGLVVALKENKRLAEEIKEKDKTIADLQSEVDQLQETVHQADIVTSILDNLLEGINNSKNQESQDEDETKKQILQTAMEDYSNVGIRKTCGEDSAQPGVRITTAPSEDTSILDNGEKSSER